MPDNNVFEMIALSHVPEVNRVLKDMVKKWDRKKPSAQKLTGNENQRATYFEALFAAPYRRIVAENHGNPPAQPPFYWFELLQYETWEWRMVHMEPYDCACNHQYQILPLDVIEQLADSVVEPDRVTSVQLHSPSMKKTLDITFVRCSNTVIYGIVAERAPGKVCWNGDMEAAFQAFFDYRNKFPMEVCQFVHDFAQSLLPELTSYKPNRRTGRPGKEAAALEQELNIGPPPDEKIPDNGKDDNLYRLIQLSRVQEFNEILKLKLKELWEGRFKEQIACYLARKKYYLEKFHRYFVQRSNGNRFSTQPYQFVLSKFAPGDWGMTEISPSPPPFQPQKEVLPESLHQRLTSTPVDPDRVMMGKFGGMSSMFRLVDVLWVRYSSNCVIGVVQEDIETWKQGLANSDIFSKIPVETKWLIFYHLLFHHMGQDQEAARVFINRFMTESVPALKEKSLRRLINTPISARWRV